MSAGRGRVIRRTGTITHSDRDGTLLVNNAYIRPYVTLLCWLQYVIVVTAVCKRVTGHVIFST